ncbi:MAG: phosphatase PAP2 family protein [Acidobacteria bacterium]|nr:phosphatase PAP2 family protein [Acidobacteriota bacterium]
MSAGASLLAMVACYLFYIRTSTGQYIDESALDEATRARSYVGLQVSQFLDALPVTSVVIATLVVLFVTVARRRWLAGGIAIVAMALANVSTQVIKMALPPRPDRGIATLDLNSLPSGHSTLAASSAAAVFLVVSPRWRPLAAFAGGSYAIISGTSTLINQWHRPSDVIAAFLVVAFWTSIAGLAILRTGNAWNVWTGYGEHWATSRIWPLLSLLIGLLAALGAFITLRQLTPAGGSHTSTTNYFWAGVALITIGGYVLTVAGTLLFGIAVRRRELVS